MNSIIILIGIGILLATLLICEIHYQVYMNDKKTAEIAILGLIITITIMIVGVYL